MVLNTFYQLVKYNTIIYCFTISFKFVTIRALVSYNPPFSPVKNRYGYGRNGRTYSAGFCSEQLLAKSERYRWQHLTMS